MVPPNFLCSFAIVTVAMSDDSGIAAVQRQLMFEDGVGSTLVPSIEDVTIFMDETTIQIINPKVEASVGANMWVVTGSSQTTQTKNIKDTIRGVLNQLSPDQLKNLKKLAEQFQKNAPGGV